MTPDERQARWLEIERQLQDIAEGKVLTGDLVAAEARLLDEFDELEWEVARNTSDASDCIERS